MEQIIPLMENNIRRGSIICQQDGCYTTFSIDLPLWGNEVKKVWLFSSNGTSILLGTLLPEQQRLKLCRRFSHAMLRCYGIGLPCRGEINPQNTAPTEQWNSLRTLRLEDAELNALIASAPQGAWRRTGEQLTIRFPWQAGQPVPLLPLFCFAHPQDGWWYITLRTSAPPPA